MRFGLIFGRLAVQRKRIWADYEQYLSVCVFSCFQGQSIFLNFFEDMAASKLKSCFYKRNEIKEKFIYRKIF